MSSFRRNYVNGGTYFFTLVTYRRRPILTTELGRRCLGSAIRAVRTKMPFKVFAIVLLPDHLHTVWAMPPNESDYSIRWSRIKTEFTKRWLDGGGLESDQSTSRKMRGNRGIWQRRFWEHTIRDEEDLKRCVDYVHWNPRKHGVVGSISEWPWSSFHRFVRLGEYEASWGGNTHTSEMSECEWGE